MESTGIRDELKALAGGFEPGVLSGAEAFTEVKTFTEIENLAGRSRRGRRCG